jgi:hypothetical protein
MKLGATETREVHKKPIPLSQSVAVGLTISPYHIELSGPLEAYYRPRYKSDYFAASGIVRKPRYVADHTGHHYIPLKV